MELARNRELIIKDYKNKQNDYHIKINTKCNAIDIDTDCMAVKA